MILYHATRDCPAEYVDRTNEIQAELEYRAECEIAQCDKRVREYVEEVCDLADTASTLAAMVSFLLAGKTAEARDLATDMERAYVQWRTETAEDSEREVIRSQIESDEFYTED